MPEHNLILGAAFQYSFDDLRLFAGSLCKAGFEGTAMVTRKISVLKTATANPGRLCYAEAAHKDSMYWPCGKMALMVPSTGIRIQFSIFIASSVSRGSPCFSVCPTSAMTWSTVPGMAARRCFGFGRDHVRLAFHFSVRIVS